MPLLQLLSTFVGFSLVGILGLLPVIWQQSSRLVQEVPHMASQGKEYLLTLPDKYPELVQAPQMETFISLVNDKILEWGQIAVEASLNSISDVVALMVYLILVPLMVFFFLKDKKDILANIANYLPKERRMAVQVSKEMNQQILNYIRGKVIEILDCWYVNDDCFYFLRFAICSITWRIRWSLCFSPLCWGYRGDYSLYF